MDRDTIGRVFRAESGRSTATLIRSFGDINVAEDAVQEAFVVALARWPQDGLPPNPGGWITTTARRKALDRLRRETRGRELHREHALLIPEEDGAVDEEAEVMRDDRLQLIFTCCHPALSSDAQVALTLRLLGGMTTPEVAEAFLVGEATMAQRLVRAKRKIKAAHIPYRVPAADELPGRIPPVLAVLYLIYTAGSSAADRPGLCAEAIRLTRITVELLPHEREVAGLLALLVLTESRRAARVNTDGSLATLDSQDRSRWDRALIEEGQAIVRECVRHDRPGVYQIQAAISAVHANAPAVEQTDWRSILTLYDQLLALAPTPVVHLNRAVVVGELDGPAEALVLVDALELDHYAPFHATRADLLRRLGRAQDATAAYQRAAALMPPGPEREFLVAGGRGTGG